MLLASLYFVLCLCVADKVRGRKVYFQSRKVKHPQLVVVVASS